MKLYTVRTYRLNNPKDIDSEIKVEDKQKAITLADAIFEATKQTTEVHDDDLPFDNVVYTRITPKTAFEIANQKVRERSLMETAMRIMDIFCDMSFAHMLNPDKLDETDFMEKLQLFCTWSREYEEEYFDTEMYNDSWLEHTETVFKAKLIEEYGNNE